jgi:hypothetical protein
MSRAKSSRTPVVLPGYGRVDASCGQIPRQARLEDRTSDALVAEGGPAWELASSQPHRAPNTRLGYGTMQLTGPGVWGDPKDPDEAIRVLEVRLGCRLGCRVVRRGAGSA